MKEALFTLFFLIMLTSIMLYSISLMTQLKKYKHKLCFKQLAWTLWVAQRKKCMPSEKEHSSCFWIALQSALSLCHNFWASSVCRLDVPSVSHCTVELYKPLHETCLHFLIYAILAVFKYIFEGLFTMCFLLCAEQHNLQFSHFLFIILFHELKFIKMKNQVNTE